MIKKVLITGSAGLVGSESTKFFAKKGFEIHGIDNNMRAYYFGQEASTDWSRKNLKKSFKDQYHHYNVDIRDNEGLQKYLRRQNSTLLSIQLHNLRMTGLPKSLLQILVSMQWGLFKCLSTIVTIHLMLYLFLPQRIKSMAIDQIHFLL